MKIKKNIMKTIPSVLESIFGPSENNESLAKINKSNTENSVNGIPFFTTMYLTFNIKKKEQIPSITKIFAIFDPIIFPNPNSEGPATEDIAFIISSGRDVENANTVSPIIRGLILSIFPILEEPSTK